MKGFLKKKWTVGCIVLAIILSIMIVNYVVIYKQNNVFKKDAIRTMKAEWYQLYHLSENVDKYYVKNNFQDGVRFRWYINQTCHHFAMTGRVSEITVNMRNLLVLAYDPLFADLYDEKEALDKKKATELFKSMNEELMIISKGMLDMQDNEIEKLLDTTSPEFIKVNTQVKNAADKYTKLVDDYFREHQR